MSRLSLIIADSDEGYLECFVNFLISNSYNKFQVHSFTQTDCLVSFLTESNTRSDILLLSPRLYSGQIPEHIAKTVILLSDGRIPENMNRYACVNKYQHAEKLITNILKIYSDENENEIFDFSGEKKTRVISVYSPAGGTGKTTVAYNLCRRLAEKNMPVFYLNLENIPSTNSFFTHSYDEGLSNMLFYLKEQNRNISLKIQALKCIDDSRVHYFPPQESIRELEEMMPGELAALIRQLKQLNQYEIIMVDMSSVFNKQTEAVLRECDKVLIVLTQDGICRTKMKMLEKEFERLSDSDFNLSGRSMLVLNKFLPEEKNEFEDYLFMDNEIMLKLPFEAGGQTYKTFGESPCNPAISKLLNKLN